MFVSLGHYNPTDGSSLQGGNTLGEFANLNITGDASIGGNLAVAGDVTVTGSLRVDGDATFAGNMTVEGNTTLEGDVEVKGRVYSYGEAPAIEIAAALGSLGEAAISGTDSAGSVVFKAGAGLTETLEAGEAITVTFNGEYDYEPRVQVTPTSEHAAQLEFYVQRDKNGFKIVFTEPLEGGKEYRFDYFIVGADSAPTTSSFTQSAN